MTKIKFCGLSAPADIEAANAIRPEFIGFVFAPGSRRYVTPEQAADLKKALDPGIPAVGVFVNEAEETIVRLAREGTIDLIQLHGKEDDACIRRLQQQTGKEVIRAFRVTKEEDAEAAEKSPADCILLDSGAGTGCAFDWGLLKSARRPYFLAGGLTPENAGEAVRLLRPYAVDVSSGIESGGKKDRLKMEAFAAAVRSVQTVRVRQDAGTEATG